MKRVARREPAGGQGQGCGGWPPESAIEPAQRNPTRRFGLAGPVDQAGAPHGAEPGFPVRLCIGMKQVACIIRGGEGISSHRFLRSAGMLTIIIVSDAAGQSVEEVAQVIVTPLPPAATAGPCLHRQRQFVEQMCGVLAEGRGPDQSDGGCWRQCATH